METYTIHLSYADRQTAGAWSWGMDCLGAVSRGEVEPETALGAIREMEATMLPDDISWEDSIRFASLLDELRALWAQSQGFCGWGCSRAPRITSEARRCPGCGMRVYWEVDPDSGRTQD